MELVSLKFWCWFGPSKLLLPAPRAPIGIDTTVSMSGAAAPDNPFCTEILRGRAVASGLRRRDRVGFKRLTSGVVENAGSWEDGDGCVEVRPVLRNIVYL